MEQELNISKDEAVLKIFSFLSLIIHKSDGHVYWIYFKSQVGDHMSRS